MPSPPEPYFDLEREDLSRLDDDDEEDDPEEEEDDDWPAVSRLLRRSTASGGDSDAAAAAAERGDQPAPAAAVARPSVLALAPAQSEAVVAHSKVFTSRFILFLLQK